MENSHSDAPDVAAVAARLPPVRYYAPYDEEEEQEEDPDPVQDPDSPQSPGELPHGVLPLVFPNPNRPPPDYKRAAHLNKILHNDEPTPPPPPEPEPAPAEWRRSREGDDKDLYCVVDTDDPESLRRCHELQSKRYAVFALRHYNADPGNGVKYELVEATGSQGIVLGCGHIIGHVTFTARPATDDVPTDRPRPFFAEVHQPDLVPACVISMDDGEEDDYELCEFCDHLRHPKVPPQLRAQMTRRIEREECDRMLVYQRKNRRP